MVGDRVTVKFRVQLWNRVGVDDDVFIGPNMTFTNDLFPRSKLYRETFLKPHIKAGASIGWGVILPGLTIGEKAMVGAGSVVTKTVPTGSVVRLANLWLKGCLAAAVGLDLSCEAYRRTLYQPYGVHVQRNSAPVITGTTTQIARTVDALTALLQLVTAAVVATGLLAGLLLIDWAVALGAAALFGSVYGLLAITTRKELELISQRIASAAKQKIKALQEGLGAIRDVLLDGN